MIKLTSLAEESSRSQAGTHSTTSFLSIATDACKRAWNKVNFEKLVSRKNKMVLQARKSIPGTNPMN